MPYFGQVIVLHVKYKRRHFIYISPFFIKTNTLYVVDICS